MLAYPRRYFLVVLLLLAGIGLSRGWRQQPPPAVPPSPDADRDEEPAFTYFVDVAGWYRVTPYETVVLSPYDLRAGSSQAMAEALPASLGDWRQVGPDRYIGDDPAVVYYLGQPTIALQRTYRHPDGQEVTLALIGNRGEESYLLFSHTPETCYPGRLWQVVEHRRESALLDERPMHAQYLLTEQAQSGQRLLTLYWYLWDNPQRDPQAGVLSMRVNLFLAPGQGEEEALARAWDFVRVLFPHTLPWERF